MLEAIIERWGEPLIGLASGALIGLIFGILAQRSRFCMRSAVIEVGRGHAGPSLALWLLAVGTAIAGVQGLMLAGVISADPIRMLNGGASLSGAAVGGLLFGIGMVLSRGCVSRLLVLSASGNFRSIVTATVFVATAYATMKGPLGDARAAIAGLWQVEGRGALDLTAATGLGARGALLSGLGLIVAALVLGARRRLSLERMIMGIAIGAIVAGTYALTGLMNAASFDPQPVRGLSFIAPAVNATTSALSLPGGRVDFDFGLIPGVIVGAFLAALLSGSLRREWFHRPIDGLRYLSGAVLMGFGGVLAGGCSMGNGVSGWAIYATGALVALAAMWIGALLADALIDRPATARTSAAAPLETASAAFRI
ncbi:MAG TPA: YeeE/YedE family protein [Beijerinckiaceae bacterium]|nr:YeeE/YedE family protein [Beijerinckiaceae bacterium]